MTFDSRWKNPQGSDPKQLHLWAQDLIKELRKGEFFDAAFQSNVGTGLTNAQLAQMAAWTIKMRNAGTAGAPQDQTINDLTEETSIDRAADFLPLWDASGSVMRKAKPNNLAIVTPIAAAAISGGTTNVDIALGSHDLVEIDLIALEPSDDAANVNATFSQDGGSSFLTGASDYGWGFVTSGALVSDDADARIAVGPGIGNAAGERGTRTIRIFRPAASSFAKTMTWFGGQRINTGAHTENQGWGQLLANTNAITHVRFSWSAGTYDVGYYAARGYRFA